MSKNNRSFSPPPAAKPVPVAPGVDNTHAPLPDDVTSGFPPDDGASGPGAGLPLSPNPAHEYEEPRDLGHVSDESSSFAPIPTKSGVLASEEASAMNFPELHGLNDEPAPEPVPEPIVPPLQPPSPVWASDEPTPEPIVPPVDRDAPPRPPPAEPAATPIVPPLPTEQPAKRPVLAGPTLCEVHGEGWVSAEGIVDGTTVRTRFQKGDRAVFSAGDIASLPDRLIPV